MEGLIFGIVRYTCTQSTPISRTLATDMNLMPTRSILIFVSLQIISV